MFQIDGEPCENDSYCFEGECQDVDETCRSFFGKEAFSNKRCYETNLKGKYIGNCGKTRPLQYIPCEKKDIFCGLLQCGSTSSFNFTVPKNIIKARHFNRHSECLLVDHVIFDKGDPYPGYQLLVNDGLYTNFI